MEQKVAIRLDSEEKGNPMIIAIIWLIALAGVFMMKKIAPKQSTIYAVYVLVVCVIFTIVTLFA